MLRSCAAALLCLGLILGSAGCGGGAQHSSAERYFLVATNIKVPYWQDAGAGLSAAARQLQVRADLVGPDTYDPQAQKAEFQRILTQNPAGILVSPANPMILRTEIDKAVSSGIPVIAIDSDSPASKRLLFVGTNNYQAGLMGGRTVAQKMGGKGNVAVFTITTQQNLEERLSGYRAAFESQEGIKIVDIVEVQGDPRIAFDRTQAILDRKTPAVDAFVCLEAVACKEVAEVLTRAKVTGKIVMAMDTQADTLEWIEKGVITGTIAQKPYTMAYYGLKMLGDLYLNKLPNLNAGFSQDSFSRLPVFVDTGATLLDKFSVASFRQASSAAAGTNEKK